MLMWQVSLAPRLCSLTCSMVVVPTNSLLRVTFTTHHLRRFVVVVRYGRHMIFGDHNNGEILKAVIAFSSGADGIGTAILWCSEQLRDDMRGAGVDPDDCFMTNRGAGVFVWEGKIVSYTYPSTPDSAEDYDVEYKGTLRDLTDAEWALLREGKNPLTGCR